MNQIHINHQADATDLSGNIDLTIDTNVTGQSRAPTLILKKIKTQIFITFQLKKLIKILKFYKYHPTH